MDKGIFYLACTMVIIAVVVLVGFSVTKQVSKSCVGKVVSVPQVVVATPSPTATPSATPVFRRMVPAPTK